MKRVSDQVSSPCGSWCLQHGFMSRLKPRKTKSVVLVSNQPQLHPGTLFRPPRELCSARGKKPTSHLETKTARIKIKPWSGLVTEVMWGIKGLQVGPMYFEKLPLTANHKETKTDIGLRVQQWSRQADQSLPGRDCSSLQTHRINIWKNPVPVLLFFESSLTKIPWWDNFLMAWEKEPSCSLVL